MTLRERLRRLEPQCRCVPILIPRCQEVRQERKLDGCEERAFLAWLGARELDKAGHVSTNHHRYCELLDIVDCDCPFVGGKPCCHIVAGAYLRQFHDDDLGKNSRGRGLGSIHGGLTWADFLEIFRLTLKDDRPFAPMGVNSTVREQRVELFIMRQEMDVCLFHPLDRVEIEKNPWLAKTSERFGNGTDSRDEELVLAHEMDYEWEGTA